MYSRTSVYVYSIISILYTFNVKQKRIKTGLNNAHVLNGLMLRLIVLIIIS